MIPASVIEGDSPVILAIPHAGMHVPPDIMARLNDLGQTLGDADWHMERLYGGLLTGATIVRANFHRYVIDANRDPSGTSLYPGQNTTGLVPLTDFDGRDLWLDPPDAAEIEARIEAWHRPYHDALRAQIERVHTRHGVAVLYDCHSIRSVIPFLFEGVLPDFNIGTDGGRTCARELEERVAAICRAATDYSSVVNGRFRGGWTTRHYGEPERGVHAIQMELAQSAYLRSESLPFDHDEVKSKRLRIHLAAILAALEEFAADQGAKA